MSSNPPREIYQTTIHQGVEKATAPFRTSIAMTFLAGAYIAIGAFLAVRVGDSLHYETWGGLNKFIFAGVFPIGLMLIVLCGADLFTGNCMTLAASLYHRKISLFQTVRHLISSWCGNFIGALFVVYCIAYLSTLIFDTVMINGEPHMPWACAIVKIANTKCSLGFAEAFWRGVGCNWLVCLAVYSATAAKDTAGKIIALWIPTTAFVALGMEHCVANMFFVPLGIITGSDPRYAGINLPELNTTWADFMSNNMIPVTLGNLAGGAILVAGIYWFAYSKSNRT